MRISDGKKAEIKKWVDDRLGPDNYYNCTFLYDFYERFCEKPPATLSEATFVVHEKYITKDFGEIPYGQK